jgi:predicted dehydrogenase
VRFGLIGTGYWADVAHAAGIRAHPQAELVGVWGRDPRKAEALAGRHGATPFAELDALLDAVDAVAFSVPPDVQGALAPRAAAAGKALLLEKPLALEVGAGERIVEAARAPTVVLFTFRLDPTIAAWYREEVDGRAWDGATMLYLGSIFEADNPFGGSPWRREKGGLWDVGPHALAALLPALGPVEELRPVRGPRDEVHLALRHRSGAASSVVVSLSAPHGVTEVAFWGQDGFARRADYATADRMAAYGAAIDALLAGETPFDARFGLEVTRVLAGAEAAL